ncbi:60 kDa SS-A/Ro ribonucleoprotein [Irineochytrium annulatum]|nr:60 kDa SS-A/Ro ribonucleoprotein [Irineochytrium annulatum]
MWKLSDTPINRLFLAVGAEIEGVKRMVASFCSVRREGVKLHVWTFTEGGGQDGCYVSRSNPEHSANHLVAYVKAITLACPPDYPNVTNAGGGDGPENVVAGVVNLLEHFSQDDNILCFIITDNAPHHVSFGESSTAKAELKWLKGKGHEETDVFTLLSKVITRLNVTFVPIAYGNERYKWYHQAAVQSGGIILVPKNRNSDNLAKGLNSILEAIQNMTARRFVSRSAADIAADDLEGFGHLRINPGAFDPLLSDPKSLSDIQERLKVEVDGGIGSAVITLMESSCDRFIVRKGARVENTRELLEAHVDPAVRLRRFLILGTEGGTYHAGELQLTAENARAVAGLIAEGKGKQVVDEIVKVSEGGMAAKQDPCLFALAMAIRLGDEATKTAAYSVVSRVCRIPTHLFQLIEYTSSWGEHEQEAKEETEAKEAKDEGWVKEEEKVDKKRTDGVKRKKTTGRGFGKGFRKSVGEWYNGKAAKDVAFLATKYKQRNGWSHADVLRLAHVKPSTAEHDLVYKFACFGMDEVRGAVDGWEMVDTPASKGASSPMGVEAAVQAIEVVDLEKKAKKQEKIKEKRKPKAYASELPSDEAAKAALLRFFDATEKVIRATPDDLNIVVSAVKQHRLAREHLPSSLLNLVPIWEALLSTMGPTAMLRNLGKMTTVGLLTPDSDATKLVCKTLRDRGKLTKARVHPFDALLALQQYRAGRGLRGSLTWEPVPEVVASLADALEASFDAVVPTGKRFLVALDVSGSMASTTLMGTTLTCDVAAAAMAMTLIRKEECCRVCAFQERMVEMSIGRADRLEEVVEKMKAVAFGATDCAEPILWAMREGHAVDVFVVYTDSQTYFGEVSPAEALKQYREKTGIQAKMIVVGLCSNGFSIADPADSGMMDVVGFDSSAPTTMREFILGNL